jgi:hypothetical protein
MVIKSPKATHAEHCHHLEQLPNVGPAMASDFRLLGIEHPVQLLECNALALYQRLGSLKGQRQDPCVLDTFMAAIDFMQGSEPRPWWAYTSERKRQHGAI